MPTNPEQIDRAAPVISNQAIDITAPVERLWALQTDVNTWPGWQKDITYASLEQPFEQGSSFTWESFGFRVTSHVYAVDARRRILWGGTADGITGIHEWIFEPTATGVHVSTRESFGGEAIVADAANFQRILDGSLTSWLRYLKAAGE